MFENKLIGDIPDNTYVLTYSLFDDRTNQGYTEAFYCMSKYSKIQQYSVESDVRIASFYG